MAAYKDKLRQQNNNLPRRSFYRKERRESRRRPKAEMTARKKPAATPGERRAAQLRTTAPAAAVSSKLRYEVDKQNEDRNSGVSAAGTAIDAGGNAAGQIAVNRDSHRFAAKLKNGRRSSHDGESTGESSGEKLSFFGEDTGEGGAGLSGGKDPGGRAGEDGKPAGAGNEVRRGTKEAGHKETGEQSNPLSRQHQQKRIRRSYAAAARQEQIEAEEGSARAAKGVAKHSGSFLQRITGSLKDSFSDTGRLIADHLPAILTGGVLILILASVIGSASSCSMMIGGSGNSVVATSYTSEDEDILGVEEDYKAMEAELREEINSVETDQPGYDEYRYVLDEIGHNPYELASILTILFEDYQREDSEVQEMLKTLFAAQYEISYEPETEIRTREAERTGTREVTDPETGAVVTEEYTYTVTEEYEYRILNVTVVNHKLRGIIDELGLSEDRMKRFEIVLSLKGNRPYLFQDDIYANIDADAMGTPQNPYLDYRVPGEALTDQQFARMLEEAEKYLGRAYVWGGSSPSEGFDCSGYVCWLINKTGVGSIGRTTAEGLRRWTAPIAASERKPGDIVYFQGTYDTPGASHVGLYVGNGMMIHCGNPCKYSNIDRGYFADHMLGYGRIPEE